MEILFLIIGAALGLMGGYFFGKSKAPGDTASRQEAERLGQEKAQLLTELKQTETRREEEAQRATRLEAQLASQQERYQDLERQWAEEQRNHQSLSQQHYDLKATHSALQQQLSTQQEQIEDLNQKFLTEFRNVSSQLLEETGKSITERQKEQLGTTLQPFQEAMKAFKEKVEKQHQEHGERHVALNTHIQHLSKLNEQLSLEAQNLAKALKGDNKMQGDWGEQILERLLEMAGLQKGRDYTTQESGTTEEGRRLRTDVVLHLPGERHMVIDSKVSLTAYERYVNAEDEASQQAALAEHVQSLKSHVKGLSDKNYNQLYKLSSLDFILLFVPIEAAFTLAMQQGEGLFSYALERNIVFVTPSTLLATLTTVRSVWQQEDQKQNVLLIADEAGKMYDKFVGFAEDLVKLGNRLNQANTEYGEAMNKLQDGRGNLVGRAEKLRKLGAKVSKQLPKDLLANADELLEEGTSEDE